MHRVQCITVICHMIYMLWGKTVYCVKREYSKISVTYRKAKVGKSTTMHRHKLSVFAALYGGVTAGIDTE